MKNLIWVFAIVVFFSASAHAGLMIEPYVGYESGSMKQTNQSAINNTGVYYGGRLGYRVLGLKFGLDYQMGSETGKQDGHSGDYKPTDMGAFVGFEFPMLLQVYGSYFVQSKAKFEGMTDDFKGDGMRFGIGWTGLPFLSVNLEVIMRTYKKYGSTDLTDTLKGNSTALSISIPLP